MKTFTNAVVKPFQAVVNRRRGPNKIASFCFNFAEFTLFNRLVSLYPTLNHLVHGFEWLVLKYCCTTRVERIIFATLILTGYGDYNQRSRGKKVR